MFEMEVKINGEWMVIGAFISRAAFPIIYRYEYKRDAEVTIHKLFPGTYPSYLRVVPARNVLEVDYNVVQ